MLSIPLVLVLLSAYVEIFSVSCMCDFSHWLYKVFLLTLALTGRSAGSANFCNSAFAYSCSLKYAEDYGPTEQTVEGNNSGIVLVPSLYQEIQTPVAASFMVFSFLLFPPHLGAWVMILGANGFSWTAIIYSPDLLNIKILTHASSHTDKIYLYCKLWQNLNCNQKLNYNKTKFTKKRKKTRFFSSSF